MKLVSLKTIIYSKFHQPTALIPNHQIVWMTKNHKRKTGEMNSDSSNNNRRKKKRKCDIQERKDETNYCSGDDPLVECKHKHTMPKPLYLILFIPKLTVESNKHTSRTNSEWWLGCWDGMGIFNSLKWTSIEPSRTARWRRRRRRPIGREPRPRRHCIEYMEERRMEKKPINYY